MDVSHIHTHLEVEQKLICMLQMNEVYCLVVERSCPTLNLATHVIGSTAAV